MSSFVCSIILNFPNWGCSKSGRKCCILVWRLQICVSGHVLATFHASLVELGLGVVRGSGPKFASGDVLTVGRERLEGGVRRNLF